MWRSGTARKLEKIVGKGAMLERAEALQRYDFGQETNCPSFVCFPETQLQVFQIVGEAIASDGIVLSGISPSNCWIHEPAKKTIWIDLSRMNRVIEMDAENLRALVQPGVLISDLSKESGKHGLGLLPYSADGINRASGLVGTSIVTGVQVVLPSGHVATIGGKVEGSAGYDMAGIFADLGSRLGIVVEITVVLRRLEGVPGELKSLINLTPVKANAEEGKLLARLGEVLKPKRLLSSTKGTA